MRGVLALAWLLLSAAAASAAPLTVTPSPAPAGTPIVISGAPCTPAAPMLRVDGQTRTAVKTGDAWQVQTSDLAVGSHTVSLRCGSEPAVEATFAIIAATNTTASTAASDESPTVVCAQNLMPKDGWWQVGANGVVTDGGAAPPTTPCAASVRWVVRMEDAIAVRVKGYSNWLAKGDRARQVLHLFVNGIELDNLTLRRQGPAAVADHEVLWTPLTFETREGDDAATRSREAWAQVLRMARNSEALTISIGPAGGPYWTSTATIRINSFPTLLARWSGGLILTLAVVLLGLGIFSSLLRDNSGGANPPFSLARHQMAVWFFVVIAAFLFVTMSTGAAAATSTTALVLIGISGAIGLAAVAIDKASAETKAESRGWWRDLLSDDNGVSLHRLQMAAWTVVFVGVFVVTVWRTFAMPEFDATTLGLMGISSGMYLGFKVPEKAT